MTVIRSEMNLMLSRDLTEWVSEDSTVFQKSIAAR